MQKLWSTHLFYFITLAFLFVNQASAAVMSLSVVTEEAISLQYRSKTTNEMEGPAAAIVEKTIKDLKHQPNDKEVNLSSLKKHSD